MKYIMFKRKIGDLEQLLPFIFPSELVHKEIATVLKNLTELSEARVVNSGEISVYSVQCYGRSQTLDAKAGENDNDIIEGHDYFHGFETDTAISDMVIKALLSGSEMEPGGPTKKEGL